MFAEKQKIAAINAFVTIIHAYDEVSSFSNLSGTCLHNSNLFKNQNWEGLPAQTRLEINMNSYLQPE